MRAALGRNHSSGPPRTYWGALLSFTWSVPLRGIAFEGLVTITTSQARRPFPPPGSRPTPEKTRKAFSSEVYALEKRLPPGARTRDGQTKSFLNQVTRWRRQKATSQIRTRVTLRRIEPSPPASRGRTGNHLNQSGVGYLVATGLRGKWGDWDVEPWSGRFHPRPGASCLPSPPPP